MNLKYCFLCQYCFLLNFNRAFLFTRKKLECLTLAENAKMTVMFTSTDTVLYEKRSMCAVRCYIFTHQAYSNGILLFSATVLEQIPVQGRKLIENLGAKQEEATLLKMLFKKDQIPRLPRPRSMVVSMCHLNWEVTCCLPSKPSYIVFTSSPHVSDVSSFII